VTGGAHTIALGIDAGGTTTRARAVQDGAVVFEGRGGPANAISQPLDSLTESFAQALRGCPAADVVVACVAGASADSARQSAEAALRTLLPAASVRVLPDFVGAFAACPDGTRACVIAGTGSVVCSPDGADGWRFSGGRGWLFGDHGSAAHLGKLFVRAYVTDPDAASAGCRTLVRTHFGTDEWHAIVAAVQSSPAPALLLAGLAPHVTELATVGDPTAADVLTQSMAGLAGTVTRHVARYAREPSVRIALSGGMWASAMAIRAFVTALVGQCPGAVVDEQPVRPLDGAVLLAGRKL
jgi:N-acetylglucosamine kinase-like BadF-type ATPase